MINIRNYNSNDYSSIESLYKDSATFGGQFDEARDSKEQIDKLVSDKPEAVLVAEVNGEIGGTVTIFEDGRSAWLYRFAVKKDMEAEVTELLWAKAKEIVKRKGHTQVLVYAPVGNGDFEHRYLNLGFTKGSDFTAYWQDIN